MPQLHDLRRLQRRPRLLRPLRHVVLGSLFALLCACQSSKAPGSDLSRTEPYVPLPDEGPESIGFFLTRFDTSLQQWSELELAASSAKDRNTLEALVGSMRLRAQKRQQELLDTLEDGAPVNRRIAAAALGFTGDPSVLGPLLSALSDPDPGVVQKALLGLGILARPDTPASGIRLLLLDDPDPWTRNNAAFALLRIANAGAQSAEVAESCRAGCLDTEPGVRAQCASALGLMADPEAVPALTRLLHDEANLVALAAAAALARIGHVHAPLKGSVARSLADALEQVQADRRVHLHGSLVWLAGQNLGEDARPWREWAHNLP